MNSFWPGNKVLENGRDISNHGNKCVTGNVAKHGAEEVRV
jgi:hypothetical protein